MTSGEAIQLLDSLFQECKNSGETYIHASAVIDLQDCIIEMAAQLDPDCQPVTDFRVFKKRNHDDDNKAR